MGHAGFHGNLWIFMIYVIVVVREVKWPQDDFVMYFWVMYSADSLILLLLWFIASFIVRITIEE